MHHEGGAEGRGDGDRAQGHEARSGQLRDQGSQVVVEGWIWKGEEVDGRGDIQRFASHDAHEVLEGAALHPLELEGIDEPLQGERQIQGRVAHRGENAKPEDDAFEALRHRASLSQCAAALAPTIPRHSRAAVRRSTN